MSRIDSRVWIALCAFSLLSAPVFIVFAALATQVRTAWTMDPTSPLYSGFVYFQLGLYLLTTALARKWYLIVGMLLLLPVAGSFHFVAQVTVACQFFHNCR